MEPIWSQYKATSKKKKCPFNLTINDKGGGQTSEIENTNKRKADDDVRNQNKKANEDLERLEDSEGENPRSHETGNELNSEYSYEVDNVLVVELIGKSKDEKIIKDKGTINNLIKNSPLGPKYSGLPRRNITKHELILVIDDKSCIPDLLKIENLRNDEGDWPVKCRMGLRNPGLNSGVLKGIDPDVKLSRVESELKRNKIPFRKISRINSKGG